MNQDFFRRGFFKLLEIKDSDIRMMTIQQGWDAVDHGIHIGGAMSGVIPLVSLYYSGIMELNIEQPTEPQDMFILSKGHGVATLASIYADLGYFNRNILKNSRSGASILNGHPGPLLPGVHVATGPMGQGICVGGGLAIAGKGHPRYDVFVLTGDGELQEGTVWEAVMYAGAKKLDNFCVLVDKNGGQLDDPKQNSFPMYDVAKQFEAFGFTVYDVDATEYGPVVDALEAFKYGGRNGKPTAIICNSKKGFGSLSSFMIKHKVNLTEELTREELRLQKLRRQQRVFDLFRIISRADKSGIGEQVKERLFKNAEEMQLQFDGSAGTIEAVVRDVKVKPAAVRNKKIAYDESLLPDIERGKEYQASEIVSEAMKAFALDERVVSIDSDLSSTSGLQDGTAWRDQSRALNVGIAEANMMCIGESFALQGNNVWVSTFCPFFNWNVMRRIAVGQQERLETIAEPDTWLTDGHGLDLTFLATAPNFETKTNGATHMGNEDFQVFGNVAHLRIIDVSCPRQLLAVMKWIMEGSRGLMYVRILRSPSTAIYDSNYTFEYGRGYYAAGDEKSPIVIVSSGRGVYEGIEAAERLTSKGNDCAVIDMPSIDDDLLWQLAESGKRIVFAEQNNGYIWDKFRMLVFNRGESWDSNLISAVNTTSETGKQRYIHSATYGELLERFSLRPEDLTDLAIS